MAKKMKLTDAARDLQISPKELVAFLEEHLGEKKTTSSSVTEREMNLMLEFYSQKSNVSSFDAYFATKNQKQNQNQNQNQKNPKNQKNQAKQAKQENPDKSAPAQSRKPKKQDARQDLKQDVKQDAKSSSKTDSKADSKSNPKHDKFQINSTNSANSGSKKQRKEEKRRKAPQERGEKTRLGGIISTESVVSSTPQPTENSGKRRTVDTRGSYIELDKYNERYEQIAPADRRKDNYSTKKQKINQKSAQRGKKNNNSRKQETEAQRLSRLELERARKQQLKVKIPDSIQVGELASRLKITVSKVIGKLMGLGIMASINEEIDFDTASLVAEELGAKVEKEVIMTIEERLIESEEVDEENQQPRPPVVVVMGHVDHGKTSILDRIRHANVTASEAGGITQHIGAYQVKHNNQMITFLDTPGHEAFTSMRARGANITDIAILVVAADDGIMPQTVESINHAKAAGTSVIVAINKMDKEAANPDKVLQQLTEYGLVCEQWGGDTICIPVSAKTGEGINELLENILLVSEVKELTANPDRLAKGTVVEARLDKGRGPIATLLVQKGTLHTGDIIIAGTSVGRVRVMTNYKGNTVKTATPSVPVEITGLDEVPCAGDIFDAVEDERLAKELVEQRKHEAKEAMFQNTSHKLTLDNLFSQIAEGETKELPIIVKADVQGSAEAVKTSLEKLSNDEVRVRVIHSAVGAVKESDVMLANASNAIIVGFNVRPDNGAAESAARDGVDIRLYRIIYDAIEEITTAMKGMLAPKFREVILGKAEVRQLFKISSVGTVAGSYILEGKLTRQCQIRIVRDGIIIADDHIAGLQRMKDSVKEVASGYECGISLEKFNDIKTGDIFEAYIMEEYQPE
ncbi:MAG: translation initiation factor IF-2 [Oscillospiraceae bacterium]|nr:translation initiation factor IF-2 [Oscillospiraceae bacterium]